MPAEHKDHVGRFDGGPTNDDELIAYICDLLQSLQKLCDQRDMRMLSHFIGIARTEASRIAGNHTETRSRQ